MKLNIYSVDGEKIGNYLNFNLANYEEIDTYVDAGECEEIRINLSLNYMDLSFIPIFMDKIVSKLSYGGKLYASTYDIIEVSKAIQNRNVNGSETDVVVAGNKLLFWSNKNLLSIEYLDKLLRQAELQILNKRTVNYVSSIVGQLPTNS